MAVSLKQLKELESTAQDKLYNNLKLLTQIYPTTKQFNEIFQPEMFAKNNKVAFQHVVHYLFGILDPELTKERITAWPLTDPQQENKFRNEVVGFVDYINAQYDHANVPNLMPSQLVSPGGFKFVKFMLKLTIFVTYEHLKKNDSISPELLSSITPHKNPNITDLFMKNMKANTAAIEKKTQEKWEEFTATHEKALQEAQEIAKEQTQVDSEISHAKNKLKGKKKKYNKDNLEEKKNILKAKMLVLEKIKSLCSNGKDLVTFLSDEKPVIDFKKEDLVVPDSVKHLVRTENILDLHHLFKSLSTLLENESLEIPVFTVDQLNELTKFLTDLEEKYVNLEQNFTLHHNELVELGEHFPSGVGEQSTSKAPEEDSSK